MTKKRRIKNKFIRKVLRQIENWDKCPANYRRNFAKDFEAFMLCVFGAGIMIGFFFAMFVGFC